MPRMSSSSCRGATSAAASWSRRAARWASAARCSGNPVVATAILDRLPHHSHVLRITGESYGLGEKRPGVLNAAAAPGRLPPNLVRKERRLAETGRCQQHGDRTVEQRTDGLHQRSALDVVIVLLGGSTWTTWAVCISDLRSMWSSTCSGIETFAVRSHRGGPDCTAGEAVAFNGLALTGVAASRSPATDLPPWRARTEIRFVRLRDTSPRSPPSPKPGQSDKADGNTLAACRSVRLRAGRLGAAQVAAEALLARSRTMTLSALPRMPPRTPLRMSTCIRGEKRSLCVASIPW